MQHHSDTSVDPKEFGSECISVHRFWSILNESFLWHIGILDIRLFLQNLFFPVKDV